MYTQHFHLESLPFENVPDPAYFFDQGNYNRVLSRMIDSLWAERGLMVLAGPIGTGKTTLTQKLMVSVPEKTRVIWLGEPPDTSEELLLFLTQELHIKPESPGRIFVLRDMKDYLLKLQEDENRCLLIIDEAHKISDDALECVRLLNNLEQGKHKLMQIFLIGQEEFLAKLARPELESFKQRIAWLEVMGKMTALQTHEYIFHRLKVAGCQSRIFTDDAIEAIIGVTRGTPRLINTLCDRALRVSFDAQKNSVDLSSVRRAADDIGLGSEVFLWLTNREKLVAQQVEAPASPSENAGTREASGLGTKEPVPVNADQKIHQRSVFAAINKLLDNTIGRFSDKPIMQLLISILMLIASLWFYIEHTRS